MKDVGLGGLVGADCSENDTVGAVSGATVLETRSIDSHGEVSLVHLEHSNDLLDTVDDEIATQLLRFFLASNQESRRVVFEVASI